MSIIKRLFVALASIAGLSSSPRAAGPTDFTDGSRIFLEPAHVSFEPGAGWGVMRTDLKQKDTDTQICSPTLMCREGQVYSLLFPTSTSTFEEQAEAFLGGGMLDTVEKKEALSMPDGSKLVCVIGEKKPRGRDIAVSVVFFLMLNSQKRLVAVYYMGSRGPADQFITCFPKTVRKEG